MPKVKRIRLAGAAPRAVELTLIVPGESNLANKVIVAHDGEKALDSMFRAIINKAPPETVTG